MIINDRVNNLLSRQNSQAHVRDVVGPNAGALIGEAREVQLSEINLNIAEPNGTNPRGLTGGQIRDAQAAAGGGFPREPALAQQRRTALPFARNTASNELQAAAPEDGPEPTEQPFRRASERSDGADDLQDDAADGYVGEAPGDSEGMNQNRQRHPEDRLPDEFEQDFHDLEMDQDIDENVR